MTTIELNQLLDKTFNIPVEIRTDTFPNNNPYPSLANLDVNGFSFTGKELLHAIGSKTASLPASKKDESIHAAYLYAHLLDFDGEYLGYKPNVNIDSDLQTNRSNEIGIGIGCLIANKLFNVEWDTLEPIKGRGKRFDYRATRPNQKYVYEFKGTKHRSKQNSQIESGISKKNDMHDRDESYDVELIVSAHLNFSNVEPRIILADPPFTGYKEEFSGQSELFYQLRHFSRIAQFIGDIPLSRALYQQSKLLLEKENTSTDELDDLGFRIYGNEAVVSEKNYTSINEPYIIEINNQDYVGRWINSWIPKNKANERQIYSLPKISNQGHVEIFQGLTQNVYRTLATTETEKIRALPNRELKEYFIQDQQNFTQFGDGTLMSYRIV